MSKQDKKELRQQIACEWLQENYLQFGSLRHDVVADRLQIKAYKPTPNPSLKGREECDGLLAIGDRQELWRNLTDKDINTMVCQCVAESGVNISVTEMWTALKSDMVPAVHPLRAWLDGLRPYTADQPDWIDMVARQVHVKNNDTENKIQQPKQLDSTTYSARNNTASGTGELIFDDNMDNLRPNQIAPHSPTRLIGDPAHPLGAQGEDKIQQPKQLDLTTNSARNNTASGTEELILNDNIDNLRPNQIAPHSPTRLIGDPAHPLGAHGENTHSRGRSILISPDGSNDRFAYDSSGTLSPLSSETPTSLSLQHNPAERLWRVCFKKWFVAMVASWMKDEVVNHTVLVLVGRQGIYKTTWLDHLIPPALRPYSSKLPLSGQISKDDRLRLCENGMLNIDELDAICGREMNIMKSLLTSTDINERAAYGRLKERKVRLASFCASTNKREFLTDITGNRRWLPFEVESIQNPFYTTLPYEMMYAQAVYLVQNDFNYWFDMDEIEVMEQHNEEFRAQENEEELLKVYFAVPAANSMNSKFLTTAEISEKLVSAGNIKRPMSLSRLGMILGQHGFIASRQGTPARRGWIVYERDSEEINAERKLLSKTPIASTDSIY